MKVLFLDIDGVVNNTLDPCPTSRAGIRVDPVLVGRVNGILEATEALVVISSTWRLEGLMACKEALYDQGLRKRAIWGCTPTPSEMIRHPKRGDRAAEIEYWLEDWAYEEVTQYAVLDDMPLIGCPRFVQTDPRKGIQDSDVLKVLAFLE